jgi:hypothetical protein
MASYDTLFSIRRLWTILAAGLFVMFGTLLSTLQSAIRTNT